MGEHIRSALNWLAFIALLYMLGALGFIVLLSVTGTPELTDLLVTLIVNGELPFWRGAAISYVFWRLAELILWSKFTLLPWRS